jgi:hypothetical protein
VQFLGNLISDSVSVKRITNNDRLADKIMIKCFKKPVDLANRPLLTDGVDGPDILPVR